MRSMTVCHRTVSDQPVMSRKATTRGPQGKRRMMGFLLVVSLTAALLLPAGCARAGNPKRAAMDFLMGVEKGDRAMLRASSHVPKERKVFAEAYFDVLIASRAFQRQMLKAHGKAGLKAIGITGPNILPDPKSIKENLKVSITGDKAEVHLAGEGKPLKLVRRDGKWLIDFASISLPSLPPSEWVMAIKGLRAQATAMARLQPKIGTKGYTLERIRKELEAGVKAAFIGTPAKLTKQLASADAGERAKAARVLGLMGQDAAAAVPQLISALKDSSDEVRMMAAMALGKIGRPAKEAVPALLEAAGDKSDFVRALAAGALGKTGRGAKGVVPALIGMLGDKHREVRRAAATGLGDIGQADEPVLKALIATLGKDPDSAVRVDAAQALGQLGPKAKSAVPALLRALKDGHVQRHAAEALGRIGRSAINPLIDLAVGGKSEAVRIGAIQSLGKLGPLAKPAVPVLLKCLRDKVADVRNATARALPEIKPVEKEVVAALASTLNDKDVYVRTAAAGALGDVGPAAGSAVPSLLTALKDEDWGVVQSAAIALGEIGVSEPSVISGLSRALKNRAAHVQMAAAEALGKMPRAAAPAVGNLIAVLSDNRAVQVARRNAAGALGAIGPAAKEAIPALKEAAKSRDSYIREAAVAALEKIQKAKQD